MRAVEYECPVCNEWITVQLEGENDPHVRCTCGQLLRLDADAEFENGMWHDLSKLVTVGSHWDEDIQ